MTQKTITVFRPQCSLCTLGLKMFQVDAPTEEKNFVVMAIQDAVLKLGCPWFTRRDLRGEMKQ